MYKTSITPSGLPMVEHQQLGNFVLANNCDEATAQIIAEVLYNKKLSDKEIKDLLLKLPEGSGRHDLIAMISYKKDLRAKLKEKFGWRELKDEDMEPAVAEVVVEERETAAVEE